MHANGKIGVKMVEVRRPLSKNGSRQATKVSSIRKTVLIKLQLNCDDAI